jgi:hypothetical protein
VELRVPRPAEEGSDRVAVDVVARRRTVIVLEFVGDFPAALERRVVERVSARLVSV